MEAVRRRDHRDQQKSTQQPGPVSPRGASVPLDRRASANRHQPLRRTGSRPGAHESFHQDRPSVVLVRDEAARRPRSCRRSGARTCCVVSPPGRSVWSYVPLRRPACRRRRPGAHGVWPSRRRPLELPPSPNSRPAHPLAQAQAESWPPQDRPGRGSAPAPGQRARARAPTRREPGPDPGRPLEGVDPARCDLPHRGPAPALAPVPSSPDHRQRSTWGGARG